MGSGAGGAGPATIFFLMSEKLVSNEAIVRAPFVTGVIDEGLAGVIVFVEVGFLSGKIELNIVVEVFDAFAGVGVLDSFVLLEAEDAGSGEGEVIVGTSDWFFVGAIAEAAILILAGVEEF